MEKLDERLFDQDLAAAEFRSGLVKGMWGSTPPDLIQATWFGPSEFFGYRPLYARTHPTAFTFAWTWMVTDLYHPRVHSGIRLKSLCSTLRSVRRAKKVVGLRRSSGPTGKMD